MDEPNLPRIRDLRRDLRGRRDERRNRVRLQRLTREVAEHSPGGDGPPVAFFRASTGLLRLSLNTGFSLLSAWSLRLQGIPVVHFTCQAGMSRCIQGVNRRDFGQPPPCEACLSQARRTYAGSAVHWFPWEADRELDRALEGLSLAELAEFEHQDLPLGRLVLPSLRWILRLHSLPDDEATRSLFGEFIRSAWNVSGEFTRFCERTRPRSVVVFNGAFFPEATARWSARKLGLRVVSHEVGMRRYSAFFTDGEATAYPIHIPDSFILNPAQEARLDAYLSQRFRGDFTMAGIQFWPEMRGLDEEFRDRAAGFRQVVPVFTNVVFDTSQVHANTVFGNMFDWLDVVREIIQKHPETLFVIRAHPDEKRVNKVSQESVSAWVRRNGITDLPNTIFIDSLEYLSSYELIQEAKFVMVYNSSIGLEAALLGAVVVCGGKARYTQIPVAYLPQSRDAFEKQVEGFLAAETVKAPAAYLQNARKFLYYQLYKASLPLDRYLEGHARPGFVTLKDFPWQDLLPERSPTLKTIGEGILHGYPFILEDDPDFLASG